MKQILDKVPNITNMISVSDLSIEDINLNTIIIKSYDPNHRITYGMLSRFENKYFFKGLNFTTNMWIGWNDISEDPIKLLSDFSKSDHIKVYLFDSIGEFALWFSREHWC